MRKGQPSNKPNHSQNTGPKKVIERRKGKGKLKNKKEEGPEPLGSAKLMWGFLAKDNPDWAKKNHPVMTPEEANLETARLLLEAKNRPKQSRFKPTYEPYQSALTLEQYQEMIKVGYVLIPTEEKKCSEIRNVEMKKSHDEEKIKEKIQVEALIHKEPMDVNLIKEQSILDQSNPDHINLNDTRSDELNNDQPSHNETITEEPVKDEPVNDKLVKDRSIEDKSVKDKSTEDKCENPFPKDALDVKVVNDQGFSIEDAIEMNYSSQGDTFRCFHCNVDMGGGNPRQYCGKTYCREYPFGLGFNVEPDNNDDNDDRIIDQYFAQ